MDTYDTTDIELLSTVERRVLWLATAIVHHANRVRPNTSGVKVGGHQASSASMTSIMTALWFDNLTSEDRVSVKPHASPVLHAINYLLGTLDERYLTTLRSFRGLQSYPSRTKDPDPVDYSTGSVGIGATAPIWAAITRRYVTSHFGVGAAGRHHRSTGPRAPYGRQISLLGDAELDEGACWEAILDPQVASLGEVLWVVDLNRQSLDRVVPQIAADRLVRMFEAAGWQVITLKYGRRLRELFDRPGGEALRARLDQMPNPEYQRMLRGTGAEIRDRLPGTGPLREPISGLLTDLSDGQVRAAVRDLGGHDLADLMSAYRYVDDTRPTVILAYTIKGYGLPTEGHPQNHSALLTAEQLRELAMDLDTDPDRPWAQFPAHSEEATLCRQVDARLTRRAPRATAPPGTPRDFGRSHSGRASTQAGLGRVLLDLVRSAPEVAARVVTVSPDVASSTNLGGWLNKVGIWSLDDRVNWFADDAETMLHWREHPRGQHIELGIAEVNLVGLIGELGTAWSRWGQPLLPVGTIYDPFVNRALEPWTYGMYAGGQSILVGTPSGVTLAPEGGAHQSIITPSVGLEQPGVTAYEPAFTQDLEWCFLEALSRLGRPGGESAYFRLSTRPLDQSLAGVPDDPETRELRRHHVLAGGYVLRDAPDPAVTVATMGAVVPEALAALDELARHGVPARLVCVTSADLLYRALRARAGYGTAGTEILDVLFGARTPLVTALDGHPHTLTFLGSVGPVEVTSLGVTEFGQSGELDDLYRHHGLDARSIAAAALDLVD